MSGKEPVADHRFPIDLRAQVQTARNVLQTAGIWGLLAKTCVVVNRWWRDLRVWIVLCGRRLWWTIRMPANDGVCSVEIATEHVGFFAQLTWCLCILQYCEQRDLIPDLRLTGEIYLDQSRGPNWLDYYFEFTKPISLEEIAKRIRYTCKFDHLGPPIWPQKTSLRMSLEDGARIVHKYLRPKPYIIAMVEAFWATLRIDGPVVGIHFRGTDKIEAPRVSWEHVLVVVGDYLHDNNGIQAVYVASDEQGFIEYMKRSVKLVPVYSHDDHYRSMDGRPVHLGIKGEGYKKGEDALVNALLLAKCSTLIRTSSFLSAWASIFNPQLKVILLNKPHDSCLWCQYPETEILRGRDTEYRPEL